MKHRLAGTKSSYLVYWPVIAGLLILSVLFFALKVRIVPFILMVVFFVALIARLWADRAAADIRIRAGFSSAGLFPGQDELITFEIDNDKMLPLMWLDVFCPLNKNLSLLPDDARKPEDWEINYLKETEFSLEKIADIKLSSFFWYEKKTVQAVWKAQNRGIMSISGWRIRTGDGFGLGQTELEIPEEYAPDIAVYPKIRNIYSDYFIKNVFNARTGMRGIVDDNTLIRSTRGYAPSDPVKNINWRLLARGLPLSTNVYEQILPQSAFFIFDGESFLGREKHPDEMEEALSFIASAVCALNKKNTASALALSLGDYDSDLSCCDMELSAENKLYSLAAYNPCRERTDKDNKVLILPSEFNNDFIINECERSGKSYFVAYSADRISENFRIEDDIKRKLTFIFWQEDTVVSDNECVCIKDLYMEGTNE